MKARCSRTALRDALRIVSSVVDPRNIKPILKDIHIRTGQGKLELSATDLEVGIKCIVRDVEIEKDGGIVVPAGPINGITSESKDEMLNLDVVDSALVIAGTGSRFQIMGVSEEEFPEIPGFPEERCLEIEGAILREMIEKTIFAVALEKQRYALSGVLLDAKEKSPRLAMVGTDGRRLAMIRRKASSVSPFSCEAIIPVKALQQLQKMLSSEEIVKVYVQERQVLVKTQHTVLVAQLVEGRFPPYKEIIPEDSDKKMEVEAEDFANVIRQAAVLSSRDSRSVSLTVSQGEMVVESSSAESGEAHIRLPVSYEGDPIRIRFNPDYLLDGVKAFGDDRVRLEMKDGTRAAVMRSGADYFYLLMPITQD